MLEDIFEVEGARTLHQCISLCCPLITWRMAWYPTQPRGHDLDTLRPSFVLNPSDRRPPDPQFLT